MMMSGSARIMERRPWAKVSPARGLTWTWVTPSSSYSTGSSIVMMFFSGGVEHAERPVEGGRLARAGRAGHEHRAVGLGERALEALALVLRHAELVELEHDRVLVEDAHDDRLAVDAWQGDNAHVDVATLHRQAHPAVLGQAALGDVQLRHDLDARDDAGDHPLGHGGGARHHAVDPEAHLEVAAVGLEVDVRRAALGGLGDDGVHELDDGGVLGGLVQVDDLGRALLRILGHRLLDAVLEAVEAAHERLNVLGRGDRRANLEAGEHRDVVDGVDVRRVGHGHEQRVLVDEGHGHGVVALGRQGGHEVRRRHVDGEGVQVEVVEAVALGGCPRELVVADGAGLEQHPLRRAAAGACRLHGALGSLASHEAEVDEHVGEKAPRAATPRRGRDAVRRTRRVGVRSGRGRGRRRTGRAGDLRADGAQPRGAERAGHRFLLHLRAARGGAHRLEGSRAPGPALEGERSLPHEDLETVDRGQAELARHGDERRRTRAVGEIDHVVIPHELIGRKRSDLKLARPFVQADRGAVHEQIGGLEDLDWTPAELGAQHSSARGRPVPHPHLGRAGVEERPHRGAGAPPRPQHLGGAARRRFGQRGDQARRVGVGGMDPTLGGKGERVRRPDRAGVGVGVVGQGERRLLVGNRHVGPDESGSAEGANGLGEERGRDGQALVAPALETEGGEGRLVHGGRARVRDRVPEDA